MDDLGDRIKAYEAQETGRRLLPGVPVYARIDGRSFSRFTRHMNRPFDVRMHRCMTHALCHLVEETHATIGYTQSDEISLGWVPVDHKSQIWFDGKVHKMTSNLASMATAAFVEALLEQFDDGALMVRDKPSFDARVFSLPSTTELANAFLWRNLDATKNAVSMAAHHYYSHNELHGKSSKEQQEMLWAKGINFNEYAPAFKRGVWARRARVEKAFDPQEWASIPIQHRPPIDQVLMRTEIKIFDLPPLSQLTNLSAVLFSGEHPIHKSSQGTDVDHKNQHQTQDIQS